MTPASTLTGPNVQAIDVVLAPALEAYTAQLEAHRTADYVYGEPEACTCGFTGKTNSRDRRGTRSVGLHRAAAERRASKAYDVAAKAALETLSRMTGEDRRRIVAEHLTATGVVPTLTVAPAAEAQLERIATELAEARAAGPQEEEPTVEEPTDAELGIPSETAALAQLGAYLLEGPTEDRPRRVEVDALKAAGYADTTVAHVAHLEQQLEQRRQRVADLSPGHLIAGDVLVARHAARYFHDGPELWIELND